MSNLPKIKCATLLSVKDAMCLLSTAKRRYKREWWWLRSSDDNQGRGAFVFEDGSILYYGRCFNLAPHCVRPALIINIESSNYKLGDTFIFGDKTFKIISDELAFCLEDIGYCCFRADWKAPDANDYEASDVKKFVDIWFKEAMQDENLQIVSEMDISL